MEDLASLVVKVSPQGIVHSGNQLDALSKKSLLVEKSTGKLQGAFNGVKFLAFAAGALAATGAVAGLHAVVQKTREFQILQAGLKTATGSLENASIAFKELQKLATETPYSLQQVTGAFTKLVNYGLTPSKVALLSYGDTSAALGKDLSQMVEAVADATTGEFERLKEFGIKASKEKDKITFTFRGVKTEVKNNADEIERYLIKLGQNNFAGAMADRMETLDGAISNLEDAWGQMLFAVGNAKTGDFIEDVFRKATTALNAFQAEIESGRITAVLESQTQQWGKLFNTFGEYYEEARSLLEQFTDDAETDSNEWNEYWDDAFKNFPTNLNLAVKAGIIHLEYFVNRSFEIARELKKAFGGLGDILVDIGASPEAKANYFSKRASQNSLSQGYSPLAGGAPTSEEPTADQKLTESIDRLVEETREAKLDNEFTLDKRPLSKFIARPKDIGASDALLPPLNSPFDGGPPLLPPDDPLSKFKVKTSPSEESFSSGSSKSDPSGGTVKEEEFDQLVKSLQKEEGAISDSYERRLQLVANNTAAGSKAQAALSLSVIQKYEEEALAIADGKKRELETQFEGFAEEERILKESYERRKEIILNLTEATEDEKQSLLREAQDSYQQQLRKSNSQENKIYLDSASEFFGNLSQMGSTFGKKGFEIAKAASIAQATIKMFESATGAYAALAGIPYVGPALGAVAAGAALAAGAANIAAIKQQTYQAPSAGNFAQGGIVPGTSFSGDQLQANVNSGEMVLNKGQQKNLFDIANGVGASAQPKVNIQVYNYGNDKVETKSYTKNDELFIETVIGRAANKVYDDIEKGGTRGARTLERVYNLGRGKGRRSA